MKQLLIPVLLFILISTTNPAAGQISNPRNDRVLGGIPDNISAKLKQDNPILTFEDCAAITLRNSFDLKNAELELKRRNFGYIAKQAGLRSRVDLEMTLPEYTEEREEQFNSDSQLYEFYSVKTNEQEAKLTFTQPLPTNGKISGSITANRFDQKGNDTEFTNRINLDFEQPIFTANKLQMDIYSAGLSLEKAKIAYVRNRVQLIYGYGFTIGSRHRGWRSNSLSTYYYKLYHATRKKELEETFNGVLNQVVAQAEAMKQDGTLSESEFLKLRVEMRGSSDRLYSASTNYEQEKRQLVQFLGIDLNTKFDVIQELEYKSLKIDREHAVKQGTANNSGIRDYMVDIERDSLAIIFEEIREDRTKTGEVRLSELKGGISGSVGLNKNADHYKLYYDDFDQSQSFKLNFSMPLWDWGRKEMLVEAKKVNLDIRKRQLSFDIDDTRRQILAYIFALNKTQERIELIERACEISETGLRTALAQFGDGSITAEDLILSINKSYEAQSELLNLIVEYKVELVRLANQTQWDFEKNRSIRLEIEEHIKKII